MVLRDHLQTAQITHLRSIAIIAIWFSIVNAFLYQHYGIKVVSDTARYVEYSDSIIARGIHFEKHNFWYLGYVLFLAVFKQFNGSFFTIILAQVCLSFLAAVSVYFSGWTVTKHKGFALVSSLLYIFWIKISQWNFYIHPESVYLSFTALSTTFVIDYLYNKRNLIITLLVMCITFWLKPTGFVLITSFLFTTIFIFNQKRHSSFLINIIQLVIAGFLMITLLNQMLVTFTMIETYSTGEVIYGYSSSSSFIWKNVFILNHDQLNIPSSYLAPIGKIVYFIFHNPLYFIKLSMAKGVTFILHLKPYFSLWHNFLIVLILYPCYWLCYQGIKASIYSIRLFTMFYITGHCLIVILTVEDWDGRFLLPLLPIIFIFASNGLYHYYLKYTTHGAA